MVLQGFCKGLQGLYVDPIKRVRKVFLAVVEAFYAVLQTLPCRLPETEQLGNYKPQRP